MIYFIQAGDGGPIKIGYTEDEQTLVKRLRHLQVGNPAALTLLAAVDGDRDSEAVLHAAFGDNAMRGEWFSPHAALLALIVESSEPDPDPTLPALPWWPRTERRGRPARVAA